MRDSPPELKRRLLDLSSRYRGASVVAMRTQPIPHAYRSFFRQIGLDPDVTRIPSEEAAVARLLHGQFRPENLIDDALLIAVVETGVPVWALDGERRRRGQPRDPSHGRRRSIGKQRIRRLPAAGPAGGRRCSPCPRAAVRRACAGSRGHAADRGAWSCSRSGSTGCRRSTSRRRCGFASRRCKQARRGSHPW